MMMRLFGQSQCQLCDVKSGETQCKKGQICIENGCQEATTCSSAHAVPCLITHINAQVLDYTCQYGYCQPYNCTGTGQCVNGQICHITADHFGLCQGYRKYDVPEGTDFQLHFIEPGTPGRYAEIKWSKSTRRNIIVSYKSGMHPELIYYGEYCNVPGTHKQHEKCLASSRISLDIRTGNLTIFDVDYKDDDFYYYEFHPDNTGERYEIRLTSHYSHEGSVYKAWIWWLVGIIIFGLIVLTIFLVYVKCCLPSNEQNRSCPSCITGGRSSENLPGGIVYVVPPNEGQTANEQT